MTQRGGVLAAIFSFVGFVFCLIVAFMMGARVESHAMQKQFDEALEKACSTAQKQSEMVIASSTKRYTCTYTRDLTPEEIAERKKSTE